MTYPNSTSLPTIISGNCIGELALGTTKGQLDSIMKCEPVRTHFYEEKLSFEEKNISEAKYLQFAIGFEYALEYNNEGKLPYPIYKTWMKDDRIKSMMLSSYGVGVFDYERCKRIRTEKGLAFGEKSDKMTLLYGYEYSRHEYSNFTNYIYFEEGVGFVFSEDELRAVYLFERFAEEKATEMKKLYI
jgi:hypothetical protein